MAILICHSVKNTSGPCSIKSPSKSPTLTAKPGTLKGSPLNGIRHSLTASCLLWHDKTSAAQRVHHHSHFHFEFIIQTSHQCFTSATLRGVGYVKWNKANLESLKAHLTAVKQQMDVYMCDNEVTKLISAKSTLSSKPSNTLIQSGWCKVTSLFHQKSIAVFAKQRASMVDWYDDYFLTRLITPG